MRVSVVLLLFSISCAELQRGDDQPAPEDVQPRLNRIQNQSHVERPELLTDQTTVQFDVWTELRELRDMVVEQRVKLQYSERQIEELKKENAGLAGRVTSTELKVTSTEARVSSTELKVTSTELGVDALKEENKKLTGRVTSTELGVEALREENKNTPKVAFSFGSGVSGTIGPFNADTMLVFRKEFINIGNAYSPITGVFTAPLRGVYFFRLNVFGGSTYWTGGDLFKNQEKIFHLSDYPDEGRNEYASNGVSLLLEKGDLVYVKLLAGWHIFDDINNHCTFNGFLLFPM
ncbi:complement C1q-like protein 2 isoform X2 [Astyanax mexicanus]|uniref:complement C1q-like protein 2 isoform X2 n=1 Tax=Astyanax mexicanus TaxID=7994 RepID=UPI0020CB4CBC|nr:complement C1q-like protein 2 isoform X2 [Astyanax mexicanus]